MRMVLQVTFLFPRHRPAKGYGLVVLFLLGASAVVETSVERAEERSEGGVWERVSRLD